LSGRLEQISTYGGVLIATVMVISIWLEVFFRYVLLDPLSWADELAVYCMIWMGYLGIGVGLKYGEHPSLQFLITYCPTPVQRVARWVVNVGILLLLVAATGWGLQNALVSGSRRLTAGLGISMVLPMLAIPVGGILAILLFSVRLIQRRGEGVEAIPH